MSVIAVPHLRKNLQLYVYHRPVPGVTKVAYYVRKSRPGVVALTYDDGPSKFTPKLLQTLKSKGIKATFFVLGVSIKKDGGVNTLKAVYDAGHQIALHTNTHPHLNTLSQADQIAEMKQDQQNVYDAIGVTPFYMRPPFGECADVCRKTMQSLNYTIVLWNIDSNDWRLGPEPGNKQPQTTIHFTNIYGPISRANPKTDSFIILQHDTDETSVNIAPNVIDAIKDKGFTFDTVAGCIGNNPPPNENTNTSSIGNPSTATNHISSASSLIKDSITPA
ncbi:13216_t:CDS:2, partial [Ambispora gerdemannii]